MSESQIPLYILIAFLGGCFAGAWNGRSSLIATVLLIAAIVLDTIGWMIYGFTVNWRPSWGTQNIIGGVLYAASGMIPFAAAPALLGFGLSIFVVRVFNRRSKRVT